MITKILKEYFARKDKKKSPRHKHIVKIANILSVIKHTLKTYLKILELCLSYMLFKIIIYTQLSIRVVAVLFCTNLYYRIYSYLKLERCVKLDEGTLLVTLPVLTHLQNPSLCHIYFLDFRRKKGRLIEYNILIIWLH